MILIQRGSAAQTASLFFLVPVSTAIIAFFMFDERLTILQLMGMVIVVVAVAKATKKTKK
jgi:drug/metabolite transporter (DMT)-like permease